MARRRYPTDLTEGQWAQLASLLPPPGIGPPLRHEQRVLVNAILYVRRSGCPWHLLPHDFPPWSTVYHHFRKWRDDGAWTEVLHTLRRQERQRRDRAPEPSAVIIDRQSVKTTEKGAAWLRWGPAGEGPQAAYPRGYGGYDHRGRGPAGRYPGSGRGLRRPRAGHPTNHAGRAPLGRRGLAGGGCLRGGSRGAGPSRSDTARQTRSASRCSPGAGWWNGPAGGWAAAAG